MFFAGPPTDGGTGPSRVFILIANSSIPFSQPYSVMKRCLSSFTETAGKKIHIFLSNIFLRIEIDHRTEFLFYGQRSAHCSFVWYHNLLACFERFYALFYIRYTRCLTSAHWDNEKNYSSTLSYGFNASINFAHFPLSHVSIFFHSSDSSPVRYLRQAKNTATLKSI